MASKDAWTALKYLLGFPIAILLTHVSYKDGPLENWKRQNHTGVRESLELLNGRSDDLYLYKVFDTEDEMPGNGQKCEEMNRPCEKCNGGRLSYQHRICVWKPKPEDCVLQVIKDLKMKAKVLVVPDVPLFVAQLSNVTVQHDQQITQSPATLRTIVEILVHIAEISLNITINKPLMENFLKTVDILVSDDSRESWRKLNNGITTSNTSTELLSAVEDMSSRLAEDRFTITETSIELIRTVIGNSYSAISKLPNSSTKIWIPQVHKPTSLTIIVFTTLYNVLPTRDSRNISDVQINGDVVVVKVYETLNNISFTFGVTDPSLGNPQCVFWSFGHGAWDSTGCEAKPFISKGNETGKIICECNHTTSFSILMSPFFVDDKALDYITFAGLGISVASLILLIIIYSRIGWRYNMRDVCVVNIAVCLIIANTSFIIGATIVHPGELSPVVPCSVVAFFMHVFYLAYFFWMLFTALNLYMSIFYPFKFVLFISRIKMIASVSYGVPLLIVVITIASTAGAGKYILEADVCWLNWDETKAMKIFVSLALIIVVFDIIILIRTLHRVWAFKFSHHRSERLLRISRGMIVYTPLLGLTWVLGIGTMLSPAYGIHLVFTLLNSLQGFFLLAVPLLTDPRVKETLMCFRGVSVLREGENNIPEDVPEDDKRAPERISLAVIQVSNQNVLLKDNDEHGDVNDSTGHHEAHSDSESRELPESDCPLPSNNDSHKDDDRRCLQDDIERKEVVPTAQDQEEVPLSDCSNRRSSMVVTDST